MSWISDILNNGLPGVLDNAEGVIDKVGRLIRPPQSPTQQFTEQAPPQIISAPLQGSQVINNAPVPQSPNAVQNGLAISFGNNQNLIMIGVLAVVAVGAFTLLKK